MKVLITGASGLLGRAVHEQARELQHDIRALAFTRSDPDKQLVKLDLTDEDALTQCLNDFQPNIIVHTAAERRPDVVEKNPQASQAINVDVPANLARVAAQLPSTPLLISISTDYVFDGSKPPYKVDDEPNPLNAYGVSKLQGERAVSANAKPGYFTNVRVPVLYGKTTANDESAVNVLLNAIEPQSPSSAPKKCDAYAVRYPTFVGDVAKAILRLADVFAKQETKSIPATVHFSAKEAMTKYDMCLVLSRVSNAVGYDTRTDHLDPEYEVDPLAATARPRHCKLDTSILEGLGVPIEHVSFEDWWRSYLKEKWAEKKAEEERLAAEAEAKRIKEEEERKKREAEEAEARRKKEQEEQEERRKKAEEVERERVKREEEQRIAAERRQKEEAEEAERQAAAEKAEAESKAEADRTGQDSAQGNDEDANTAQQQQQQKEDSVTVSPRAISPSNDAASGGPLVQPGSPNPSFSSLQARPTPPATSGVPSPTSSVPPSIRSLNQPGSPSLDAIISSTNQGDNDDGIPSVETDGAALGSTPTTSTSALAGPEQNASAVHSPLSLDTSSDARRINGAAQRTFSASSAGPSRLASLTDETTMFGGTVKPISIQAGQARDNDGDNDSDGYGQPSPRNNNSAEGFGSFSQEAERGQETQASAATGASGRAFGVDSTGTLESPSTPGTEVKAGARPSLESSTHSSAAGTAAVTAGATSRPPPLYHRASFDEAQRQRDAEEFERTNKTKWKFNVKVGDPQKVGDPMTAHIVYTVRTNTDAPNFRASQFSVLRRYRDFRWLHAALVHNNPGVIVPPVPEKVAIGRFQAELVEARRIGLETCINKIAQHPLLQVDEDFKLFLESDNFAVDVKQRDLVKGPIVTPEQKTYKSWGSAVIGVSSAISSGHKFHEFDEWFDQQKVYLDSLESCLKQLVKSISHLSNQRKEMALAVQDLGGVLMTLSGSSLSRSLSTCFAGLAELQRRVHELEDKQAEADVRQVGTVMYEYERVVGSVRKAFATRIETWQAWQKAEDELRKVRSRYEKLKRDSGAGSHFHSMLAEVSEAESRALEKKRLFDAVSERCKSEMERSDEERVEDFIRAAEGWVDSMVERQAEVVQEWEQYLALLGRQTGLNPATLLGGDHPATPDAQQLQQQQQPAA